MVCFFLEMEDELQKLEDELDANEEDELFCVACNKEMRNEKAFATHRKQKKHLENLQKLKQSMMEEDLLQSDDLKESESENEAESIQEETKVPEATLESGDEIDNSKKPLKKEKKKRRAKGGKSSANNGKEVVSKVGEMQCAVCKQEFKSKTKLFNHLKETGHAVPLKS